MTERKAIVKQEQQQQNLVELIRVLFPQLKEVSDVEIIKALALARKLGLDPFRREVHLVPFKGSVQLVVSYYEYVRRAEKSGKLNGWETKIGKDELGEYAEVVIHRRDWEHPFKWRVYLDEVKRDTPSWRAMPLFMLRKTAIAQGFRLAFPQENQELPEEPEEPEEIVEYETEVKTISETQARRLWAIAKTIGEEAGIGRAEVERAVREILSGYGLESTKEIPATRYEEIIEKIKTRILELAKIEDGEEKES